VRVFSTFSGISAASVAWKELGWSFAGYAEYDPHACAVLAARCGATAPRYHPTTDYGLMGDEMHALGQRIGSGVPRVVDRPRAEWFKAPNEDELFKTMEVELKSREKLKGKRSSTTYPLTGTTPNFGDIWYISDADLEDLGPIDVLEGGSPCQAFSAAGSKAGLLDFRSAGMFCFIELIERMKRINGLKWVLWENVKGVLNDERNAFGYLLGGIAKTGGAAVAPAAGRYADAGYVSGPDGEVAWRLLDAQYFGMPNRRERVYALARVGSDAAGIDPREVLFDEERQELCPGVGRRKRKAAIDVFGARAQEFAGYQGPVAFMAGQSAKARSAAESREVIPTLRSGASGTNQVPSLAYVMPDGHDAPAPVDLDNIDRSRLVVRQLTPTESERLMGFPEDWTAVEVNGAVMKDKDRYKCIGNSMSVNVMRWIGQRLDDANARLMSSRQVA
jgi:DNA (cytosine-5)-methyltransferase 1